LTRLVHPHVALVNNIAPAHIGGFSGLDAIATEKSDIYSLLEPGQTAIINLDDDFSSRFIEQTKFCRQIGFTRKPGKARSLHNMVVAHEHPLPKNGHP